MGKTSFSPPNGNDKPLFLILGPCSFESADHCIRMAEGIAEATRPFARSVIFKCSFDKANRTNRSSWRGVGLEQALSAFTHIREKVGLPVLTDIHEPSQCTLVAPFVDVLQTPAFLCRQTDLLTAAGATGLPVNIKKGQFLSPHDMHWAVDKVRSSGGRPMACERGTMFGYNTLVNDFRGLRIMGEGHVPVVFDATHSVQSPASGHGTTLGDRKAVHDLARAAVSIGIAGLFMEVHDMPDSAPSDAANMLPLSQLSVRLEELLELDQLTKAQMTKRAFSL